MSPDGDDAASAGTHDTMDSLLQRLSLRFEPEIRLKAQKRVGDFKASWNISTYPLTPADHKPNGVSIGHALVVKPDNEDGHWNYLRKFEINAAEKAVKVYSTKMKLGPVTLQVSGGRNWSTGRMGVQYKARFFGPIGLPSYGTKYRFNVNDRGMVRATVLADVDLPNLEGRISNAEDEAYQR
jgi:hypothetical protein